MDEEPPPKKTEALNTAEFRTQRDHSMQRALKLGNSMLRMIPEVRDQRDKEEVEERLEEIEERLAPPSPPPRPNPTQAIAMLRATVSDMTEEELAQVRDLVVVDVLKAKSPPLVLVLFVGVVIGALMGALVGRRALLKPSACSTEAPK